MGKYSIKELEHLSGIKAHTLRIWEKRYQLFEPKRSKTNIRYYTDDDLKKLLNVTMLSNNGTKISAIVNMSEGELCAAAKNVELKDSPYQQRINELIVPMCSFDEAAFNLLFAKNEKELGLEKTLTEVVYPFLQKVGTLWLSNEVEPCQEHFVSNIIRQKMSAAIDALPMPPNRAKKVMLFLPEGEYHELGLLFFSYLYKKRGVKTYYFGQSVPFDKLIEFSENIEVDWALTYSIIHSEEKVVEIVNDLDKIKAGQVFYINRNYPKLADKISQTSVEIVFDYRFALDSIV